MGQHTSLKHRRIIYNCKMLQSADVSVITLEQNFLKKQKCFWSFFFQFDENRNQQKDNYLIQNFAGIGKNKKVILDIISTAIG